MVLQPHQAVRVSSSAQQHSENQAKAKVDSQLKDRLTCHYFCGFISMMKLSIYLNQNKPKSHKS